MGPRARVRKLTRVPDGSSGGERTNVECETAETQMGNAYDGSREDA